MFQKNIALQWIRSNTNQNDDALVYFADDDNTYHWKLFQEVINWLVHLLKKNMVKIFISRFEKFNLLVFGQ